MENLPDETERARAAVAISCLRWLECTGPKAPTIETLVRDNHAIRALLDDDSPRSADPKFDQPHPLWDAWLDL